MKTPAAFLFASRLLFPRTGKKSNARKSLLGACACIGISLVPLVMVLTISNGMIQGITERIIGLSSSHIQVNLYEESVDELKLNEPSQLENFQILLQKVEEVTNVFPEIQGIGLASSLKGRKGASIRAVQSDVYERNSSFRDYFKVVEGEIDLSSKNSVVIGDKLAQDLNLSAGKTLRLITTKEIAEGKTIPKITPLKISAIVSSGYQELDALWVFISLETGFSILSANSSTFVLGVETQNAFGLELEKAYAKLYPLLKNYGRLYKWNQLNTAQYENFASTQIMLIFIMMLIVLVASVNISSALVMLVIERRKEIAIIKSLGGTSGGIAFSFLLTGFFTGLLGVLAGIPLGLLGAVNFNRIIFIIEKILNSAVDFFFVLIKGNAGLGSQIHLLDPAFYLQDIPLSIPLGQLMLIAIGTLVLSLFVSAIPAFKAGKEKPIDTLRKI
ncbi:MAG: ABC transporter permease [Treponema sp.]|nr:ABC transporter permease [Candidatus Treponema equifaecale]